MNLAIKCITYETYDTTTTRTLYKSLSFTLFSALILHMGVDKLYTKPKDNCICKREFLREK